MAHSDPATTPRHLRFGQYLRVSRVKKGVRPKSTDEQNDENVPVADERGWDIVATYRDDDRSASRYATKAREDYLRLIGDLEAGNLDGVMLWETSRGSRTVDEWAHMLRLIEERGIFVWVTDEMRLYDPGRNYYDRHGLLGAALDAEKESHKTSRRILRDSAAIAVKGRPWGALPYGYERVYDPETRELVAQRPKPGEAEVVKRIFEDLGKGVALSALARALNAEGVPPPSVGKRSDAAKEWRPAYVRAIALRETYRGKREHRVKGPDGKRAKQGAITDAIWPKLVDDATFYAVKRTLTDPKRRTSVKPGKAQHLLSLIAECAKCGGPMTARQTRGTWAPIYRCDSGSSCVSINKDLLDAYITDLTFARLAALWETFTAGDDNATDAELLAARAEVASLQARLDEHYDEAAAGRLSAKALARIEPQIEAQIVAARRREERAATPPTLRWLLDGPREQLRERWAAAPAAARREVVKELFSVIKVYPVGRGHHKPAVPAEERVAVVFRGAEATDVGGTPSVEMMIEQQATARAAAMRCKVDGCDGDPRRSNGRVALLLCGKHYQRYARTGDPEKTRSGRR